MNETSIPNTLEKLRNGDKVTIVAFGDSITEGYAVEKGFVDYWEESLRKKYPSALLRMINSGISGDTTFDAVDRMRRDVIVHRPDLVTVQFGINDCFSTVYRGEFRENLAWIIMRLKEETAAEIVLVTSMLPRDFNAQEALLRYYDIIRHYAKECNVGLIQLDAVWRRALRGERDFDSLVLPDGIHPSEEGYRVIAEEFMKLF